jgi:hypothetical protein
MPSTTAAKPLGRLRRLDAVDVPAAGCTNLSGYGSQRGASSTTEDLCGWEVGDVAGHVVGLAVEVTA